MSWEKEHEFKMALDQARKITKAIKYDDTVGEIMVQIEMLAEKFPGINMRDLEWKMDEVREAKNALESAVYGLEEPFEEAMRDASYEDEEDEDLNEDSSDSMAEFVAKELLSTSDGFASYNTLADQVFDVLQDYYEDSSEASKYSNDKEFLKQVYALWKQMRKRPRSVREGDGNDLFGMLSKQFEKEFGAPMSDPMAKRSERPDRQRPEPHRGNDKKEVKESVRSGILEGIKSKEVEEGKQKGLWANIHAKRKRGEPPAKPGEKGYPKTLDIDEEKERLDPKCWKGYKKQGTKMKGGVRVNNCVPK